jgi:EmrB/QacA subfamily drug resistance transporter
MSDGVPASVAGPGSTARLSSASGRGLLAATVLGSGMAFLDSTVVNVAVREIGRDLQASLASLQWTINGYTLALAALILLGGSLGDRLGRRRVFVVGVAWFAVASLACAVAPNVHLLVAARVVQGIGGALLTPGSLAMIQAGMDPDDRPRAIGLWSGLSGVSTAVGPFVGGWLIEIDWRWVFWINLPIAAVTIWLALRYAPESRDDDSQHRLDAAGAVLGAASLGAATYALIAAPEPGSAGRVLAASVVAVVLGVGFVVLQRRARFPMVPPSLFESRVFTVDNLFTFVVYAALSGMSFLLVLQLQTSLQYSPLEAGVATLPVTVLLMLLSGTAGSVGQRVGPRLPLTLGPAVAAVGLALLAPLQPGDGYVVHVLPGVLLFGLGLTALVAPLTTSVMGAAPPHLVGTASGVNNAVARTGSLIAVAALPAVAGLSGLAYADPVAMTAGYSVAMWVCVGLLLAGSAFAAAGLPRHSVRAAEPPGS